MKIKRLVILFFTSLISLGLFSFSLAIAQDTPNATSTPDNEEAAELAKSTAAEQTAIPQSVMHAGEGNPNNAPLFVGVDNVDVPAYLIDPTTNISDTAFMGVEVWGAAYDAENGRVLFNDGAKLFEWPLAGTPNLLGTTTNSDGSVFTFVGLAHYNGTLYGTRNLANEAVYAINMTTLSATVYIDYVDSNADFGGFSADPDTGIFYGTNDTSRNLEQINLDGTTTPIAPYPLGETDIDGLAIGDGNAYLITDEPGDIYIFNLETMTYTGTLMNPWTTAELFAGGAWIEQSADIEIVPTNFTISQSTNVQVNHTLTISNVGDVDLAWNISDAVITSNHRPAACAVPADLEWLTANPMNGIIVPNSSQDVTIMIDTTNLAAGMYTATLCVDSNDPNDLVTEIPIVLTVLKNYIYLPSLFHR